MKIAIIANSIFNLLNFRKPLILALQKQAEVIVFAPLDDIQGAEELKALGVTYQPFFLQAQGLNPWSDFKTYHELTRLLQEHHPDSVMSYTIKPVIWGSMAAKKAGVKKIYATVPGLGYVFTNVTTISKKIIRKIVCFLYQKALRCAHITFFQNPDDEQLFRQIGILSDDQKTKIVNGSGVDMTHYHYTAPCENPVRFLLVARLLKEKGVIEYVAAAKRLKTRYKEVEWHLVGRIDQNPDAISQTLLDEWILEKAIIFHGHLKDVRPVILASSVFVLPSFYREGTPRSILEAMSMGRPVITTDAPGCRETVIQGYNGFLVPVRDVDQLVIAMERFIENRELIVSMGLASRKLAEEKYDVDLVNREIMQIMID